MQSAAELLDEIELNIVRTFCAREVRCMIVGSVAKRVYGLDRPHRDLDLVIEPSVENATRVLAALADLRQTGKQLSMEALSKPSQRISVPYLYLDLLTSVADLPFDVLFRDRCLLDVGEVTVGVVSREHLRYIMRASGRPQDVDDLAAMREP
jgi:hypothetical protein